MERKNRILRLGSNPRPSLQLHKGKNFQNIYNTPSNITLSMLPKLVDNCSPNRPPNCDPF